jgi:phage host-nuclease inhibitor protein Gam
VKLTSWDTVDAALARLATLERRKVKAKFAGERRMARIKDRLKAIFKPLDRDFKRLLAQIEKWTFGHSDELQERTRRSAHGAVRLYKTPAAIVSDLTDEELIRQFRELGREDLIRTKREVDREALSRLTDQQLGMLCCRRESRDEFQWQLSGETEWR